MLDVKRINSLPQLLTPILTAYLNTNPAQARNQRHPPGYVIWLKSRAKVLRGRIPKAEQRLFREQVARVEEFLLNRRPKERGVVIFAGPPRPGSGQANAWEFLALQVDVEDELHWGAASLTQLLWILDEYRPTGIVFVDRSGALFFRRWLHELAEQEQEAFRVDTSQWRKKDIVPPAHPGAQKIRGAQRDVFEQRVEAQYVRFYKEIAERVGKWAQRENLDAVFLAGPTEVVEAVRGEMPKAFQGRVVAVKEDLRHLNLAELHTHLEPVVERWERERELALVNQMLDQKGSEATARAVVGMDETLLRLQQGRARELVVVRGLGGRLRQCAKCGWVDRAADPACGTCGGERRVVALRAALPELARRYSVPVEVVAGEAARKLREAGGLGALLR